MTRQTYPDSDESAAKAVTIQVSPQTRPSIQLHSQDGTHTFRESIAQVRKRVLQAAKRGEYRSAIAILNRLLISHPDSAEDYSNRGLIHLWNGEPRKALRDFNRAIAIAPDLASSYNNRANYYACQGARESAIADYDQAIDLNPFHVRARINRAITLRELRRYDEALDGLDEALAFHQLTGEIYAERGRTYHLRGDWNSAIADYCRALRCFQSKQTTNSPLMPSRLKQVTLWLTQLRATCQ